MRERDSRASLLSATWLGGSAVFENRCGVYSEGVLAEHLQRNRTPAQLVFWVTISSIMGWSVKDCELAARNIMSDNARRVYGF
jgi:hypothetical protein